MICIYVHAYPYDAYIKSFPEKKKDHLAVETCPLLDHHHHHHLTNHLGNHQVSHQFNKIF